MDNPETQAPELLAEIEPIEVGGVMISERADLERFVDAPLLEACQILYDKNIRTTMSSCNKKDLTRGFGYIEIDYNSLSVKNKEIARQIGQVRGPDVQIEIPISGLSTREGVSARAKAIVSQFLEQDCSWIERYTPEELAEISKVKTVDGKIAEIARNIAAVINLFYDEETGLYFRSSEQAQKAKQKID